jgi:hypothetical protein
MDPIANVSSQQNFFGGVMENSQSTIFAVFFSIVTILIDPPFIYYIIWFERYGSDKKRTILNMILSMSSWTAIHYFLFVQTIEIFQFVYGNLPKIVCLAKMFFKNFFFRNALLYLDAIILIRYAFVFLMKNPAAFNDDFWSLFLNLWIPGFSGSSLVAFHALTEQQSLGYYICVGIDPGKSKFHRNNGILEVGSLLLHIFLYGRIKVYSRKFLSGPQTRSNFLNKLTISELDRESLTSFATNMLCLLLLIGNTACQMILLRLDPDEVNLYPNLVQFVYLTGPNLIGFLVPLIFFMRNEKMQNHLTGEIQYLIICLKTILKNTQK